MTENLEQTLEEPNNESQIRCRWCKEIVPEKHFMSPYSTPYCNETCYKKHGEMEFD